MSKFKPVVCDRCNIEFTDEYDAERMCSNAGNEAATAEEAKELVEEAAEACSYHPSKRAKHTLRVVGPDFERDDTESSIRNMQSLISDGGVAWHPDIDQDGCLGRKANDMIARKLCKPPRSERARRSRLVFTLANRIRSGEVTSAEAQAELNEFDVIETSKMAAARRKREAV
jgi:hypothetical protein